MFVNRTIPWVNKYLQFLSHTEHISMKLAREAIGKADY